MISNSWGFGVLGFWGFGFKVWGLECKGLAFARGAHAAGVGGGGEAAP